MDLGTALRHSAAKNPHKDALVCRGVTVTYEELDRATDRLARWLLLQGLTGGDRVAIHWMNSVEVVKLFFACFKAGLIAVPVNNRLKPPEIAYILEHCKSQNLFQPAGTGCAVRGGAPECRVHVSLPAFDSAGEVLELPVVSSDRVAAILYTSGTTARPKGVTHTHLSLTGCTELMISLGLDERDILLVITQMLHISGWRAGCCSSWWKSRGASRMK